VLIATCIDAGDTEQQRFYLPFERVRLSRLEVTHGEWRGYALSGSSGGADFEGLVGCAA
jgi:hypothetical protein